MHMQEAIRKADALIEALPYIQSFAGRPVVIKFGGNAMEDETIVNDVVEDAVFLATVGIRAIIVHGGGPQISEAMTAAGLAPTFVHGLRVTDAATLDVVVRVLSEEINADIRRLVEAHGGRAYPGFRKGRSLLRARKKLHEVAAEDGSREVVDLGFVGDVVSVDTGPLLTATAERSVAVVPPIGQDEAGQYYNLNADTAAAALAGAMKAEKIVFLSNVHGIMREPGNTDTLLSTAEEGEVQQLIEQGIITGGMLPKVRACIAALDAGVRKAHIIDGRLEHSLLLEIFTDKGVGTQILKDPARD